MIVAVHLLLYAAVVCVRACARARNWARL